MKNNNKILGIDTEELIACVDENDEVLGLRPRSEFVDGRLIHRSSYLLLFDSKGRTLLQRRSPLKEWHPEKWTFPVAGTVANETYKECLEKEMEEALGINFPFKKLFKYHHFDDTDKAFKTVFMAKAEQEDLALNKDYAEEYSWIKLDKLKKDIGSNPEKYAPPFISGMKIFFNKKF